MGNESGKQGMLRTKADAQLGHRTPVKAAPHGSVENLLHELQVHQIELEMQNETLRESLLALEKSRDRYADLYQFAPAGYLTLTRDALIGEINLAGAALLGEDRNKLINRRFATLVSSADRGLWHQVFMRALQSGERQSCELMLQRNDGSCFHAQLGGVHRAEENAADMVRLTFTNITRFKEADELYRMVFEQSADAIVITDAETGVILELNQTLADMIGNDKSELIGKPRSSIFPQLTGNAVSSAVWQRRPDRHETELRTGILARSGKIQEAGIRISS
ncbi:MAG: PAS domain-containing protein [Gallionella sp.]|nr:PAS domain-containing protein [Gallionella sp.]